MKIIKHLNSFAIGLPFLILITYPIYKEVSIIYSLYSTMITGFIQVILSFLILIIEPKNKFIITYLSLVILFFSLWYFNMTCFYSDYLTYFLFLIPILLAAYLSFIIYKK